MRHDLTKEPITSGLIRFCLPLIAGNLLQQMYNIVDTFVVGRYVGQEALAAVGSAFSLMVLLTSVILGLCMGAGVVFSQLFGQRDREGLRKAIGSASVFIAAVCLLLTITVILLLKSILGWMNVPDEVAPGLELYLSIVMPGMLVTFVYNDLSAVLRSVGNSAIPLLILTVATVMNIVLDVVLVVWLPMGIAGVAWATLISQVFSAVGIIIFFLRREKELIPRAGEWVPDAGLIRRVGSVSLLTSLQQSIMNLGILMIQSLVNSFGVTVMAAFAACVKIDAFAYAPAQDFANGYATFVSQNAGAKQFDRVKQGMKTAFSISVGFCGVVSVLICLFARPLMSLFIDPMQEETIAAGIRYLHIEGACYIGIGLLFLLYAPYPAVERAGMSVVLTVISLGLRVVIAYTLAPHFGVEVIWWAIPVGWAAADITGLLGIRRLMTWLKQDRLQGKEDNEKAEHRSGGIQ